MFDNVKEADLVIFATPVYLWEMSESLWCFFTRMRRICFKWKKLAAVMAVAGGGSDGDHRVKPDYPVNRSRFSR
jgi:multimeric flavodoxin WrbA